MLPETLMSNRGIVIVPSEPKNSLANFIDKAKNNIVLIEASSEYFFLELFLLAQINTEKVPHNV